jgi:CDP-diacylglycerol--glycerol-3-phosphate 3-phosphatidyltransferase
MGHLVGDTFASLPISVWLVLLASPAIVASSLAFFLIRVALFGRPSTARIDKVSKSPYLPRIIMEYGYWCSSLPVDFCVAVGITPNMITLLSLVATIAAAVLFGRGHFLAGGWTLVFAFICDAWDGIVARRMGISSIAGEFFDATMDRYCDMIGFLGFMYYYRQDPIPLAIASLAMIGSTVTSYARAKGESVGVDPNVGYMQRHERAAYLTTSAILAPLVAAYTERGAAHPKYYLFLITLGIVALLTNITAIWRILFVMKRLRQKSNISTPDSTQLSVSHSRAESVQA